MVKAKNYYNEWDPYAAQWLRNLIAAGVIAPGDVDERSIVDVRPGDLDGYTQCHFFAGIGVWSYALRLAGWPDEEAVWTGSCPCQPFSDAGVGEAFDDERDLWPHWFPLIRAQRRERGAVPVFGEQVASKVGLAWLDAVHADLESEAYTVGSVDTCSAGFGAPHIRQRFFFVAHPARGRCGEIGDAPLARRGGHADGGEQLSYMADADGRTGEFRLHGGQNEEDLWRQSPRPRRERDAARGAFGAVADTAGLGREARSEGERREARSERDRAHGRMGDAERAGLEGHAGDVDNGREPGRDGAIETRSASSASPDGVVAHTARPEDRRLHLRRPDEAGQAVDAGPGPVNGFWRSAFWIPCRDGRARPVEPGTFPLAHGSPARVGRLRAYGNAINAEQAAEFIRAYRELRFKR
jgi:DNA (cytosine-5)-methyltransferase 1